MKMYLVLLVVLTISLAHSAPTPPNYNYAYSIHFDEAYKVANQTFRVNGQRFYDPNNNRQRIDRVNGRYNAFCGSVIPNVTTSCTQLTIDNKRWIYFPKKSQCCFCCDGAHGCGIMKPNWLEDAEYKGQDKIVDTMYDKWSKDGSFGYNYLWVTADDSKISRRLDENGAHITDYNVHSFHNQTIPFPDSVFAPPVYCNVESPTNCPLQSICGKLRTQSAQQ